MDFNPHPTALFTQELKTVQTKKTVAKGVWPYKKNSYRFEDYYRIET